MLKSQLQLKYREVAGAGNSQLMVEFLQELRDQIGDVRTDLGTEDSLILRKAMVKYLQESIDQINRIKKNNQRGFAETYNDDV